MRFGRQKALYRIWEHIAHKILLRLAISNGFSRIFRASPWHRTKPSLTCHPGKIGTFRDIHVPKFLGIERNIKKISFSAARRLREFCVQYAASNFE